MTAHKVVIIECQGCGTTALPETMIIKDLIRCMTGPPSGVIDARHMAAVKGWRHTASGKDLCPDCQTAKRSQVKSGGLLSKIPHPHWHG